MSMSATSTSQQRASAARTRSASASPRVPEPPSAAGTLVRSARPRSVAAAPRASARRRRPAGRPALSPSCLIRHSSRAASLALARLCVLVPAPREGARCGIAASSSDGRSRKSDSIGNGTTSPPPWPPFGADPKAPELLRASSRRCAPARAKSPRPRPRPPRPRTAPPCCAGRRVTGAQPGPAMLPDRGNEAFPRKIAREVSPGIALVPVR